MRVSTQIIMAISLYLGVLVNTIEHVTPPKIPVTKKRVPRYELWASVNSYIVISCSSTVVIE